MERPSWVLSGSWDFLVVVLIWGIWQWRDARKALAKTRAERQRVTDVSGEASHERAEP